MAFVSQEERIQQRLYTEMQAGAFRPSSTDPDTHLLTVDVATTVAPASVTLQALSTTFTDRPTRNRRTERSERNTWRWSVVCVFTQQISSEEVEKFFIANHIILPRDSANDLEQVTLKLLSADPFHPPQQSPSHGTRVTFTFEAELSPV